MSTSPNSEKQIGSSITKIAFRQKGNRYAVLQLRLNLTCLNFDELMQFRRQDVAYRRMLDARPVWLKHTTVRTAVMSQCGTQLVVAMNDFPKRRQMLATNVSARISRLDVLTGSAKQTIFPVQLIRINWSSNSVGVRLLNVCLNMIGTLVYVASCVLKQNQ